MTEILTISISDDLKEKLITKLGGWDSKEVRKFIYEAVDKALENYYE